MQNILNRVFSILFLFVVIASCTNKQDGKKTEYSESKEAKALLQGVWIDSESESVAFMAKGDTIYYPDSTLMPVYFAIYGDTLVLKTSDAIKYEILKQSKNIFSFRNGIGEEIKLTRSEDEEQDELLFLHKEIHAINQGVKIDRDSVVTMNNTRYHLYTTVNPTSYKVLKRTFNEDGLEVDNVYYDNIVHVSVFEGSRKIFSGDFRKENFTKYIEGVDTNSVILSDINYTKSKDGLLCFEAVIGEPDGISYFVVTLTIDANGKLAVNAK